MDTQPLLSLIRHWRRLSTQEAKQVNIFPESRGIAIGLHQAAEELKKLVERQGKEERRTTGDGGISPP